jgi:hypothetical protein
MHLIIPRPFQISDDIKTSLPRLGNRDRYIGATAVISNLIKCKTGTGWLLESYFPGCGEISSKGLGIGRNSRKGLERKQL